MNLNDVETNSNAVNYTIFHYDGSSSCLWHRLSLSSTDDVLCVELDQTCSVPCYPLNVNTSASAITAVYSLLLILIPSSLFREQDEMKIHILAIYTAFDISLCFVERRIKTDGTIMLQVGGLSISR